MSQSVPGETLTVSNEIRSPIVQTEHSYSAIEEAVLRTVAYSDVFDYPMTIGEICRYLVGMSTKPQMIKSLLLAKGRLNQDLSLTGKYIYLSGREELIHVRRQREQLSRQLWPRARRYGQIIASLPFVRMVAVTGSLAVNNTDVRGDIDYLLVTAAGRVWLCRALAILVVRWASMDGDSLCPNYILSEEHLESRQKDLYNAHELAQMVPLAGRDVYSRMRRLNRWTDEFLPNASGAPTRTISGAVENVASRPGRFAEACLSGRIGSRIEQWELQRKVRRFSHQAVANEETGFCANWCKGHFDHHASRTVKAYHERLEALGIDF